MNVALTSKLAYHSIASDREIQEARLLTLYRTEGALSDREACARLGWEAPSVVSARRNGLMKWSNVKHLSSKKDPVTGKTVAVWGLDTLF